MTARYFIFPHRDEILTSGNSPLHGIQQLALPKQCIIAHYVEQSTKNLHQENIPDLNILIAPLIEVLHCSNHRKSILRRGLPL